MGLSDRSSRPLRPARPTPPEVEERACSARSSMLFVPLGLAASTGVSPMSRIVGVNNLSARST